MALFAALSYAVTQSGRGGGNIDRETAALAASQLVQYGALAQHTINRMRIANGCGETELSFERSPFDGTDAAYVNTIANARGDFACHFFHPNGGAMTEFNPASTTGLVTGTPITEFYGDMDIIGVGTGTGITPAGTSTTVSELALIVRNLTEESCLQISRNVGLDNIATDSGDLNVAPFVGSYLNGDGIVGCSSFNCGGDLSTSPFLINNIQNTCFIEEDTGDFIYFHVLLAR